MFRRPDGRTFTRDPADVDDAIDVYASVTGDLAPWIAAGFVEYRRENRYVVPTTTAGSGEPPPGIEFVTADRGGIASALLGRMFGVLAARGVEEVTEIDVTKVASRGLSRREHRGRP